jgi:hypothetical protein
MSLNSYSNILWLSTEFVPTPGIRMPAQAGIYLAEVDFRTAQDALLEQGSVAIRVRGSAPLNFHVKSAISDIGASNILILNFEVDPLLPLPSSIAAIKTRLFLDLPTVDSQGNPVFPRGLGYQATGDKLGCWISSAAGMVVAAIPTVPVECRLLYPGKPSSQNSVEITNLAAFTAATPKLQVMIAGIRNPATEVTSARLALRAVTYQPSNQPSELYYGEYHLFLGSFTPGAIPTVPHITPALNDFFQNATFVQSATTSIELQAYLPSSASVLGSFYYLFPVPALLPLTNGQLAAPFLACGCLFCVSFPELNWVFAECTSNMSVIRPVITGVPAGVPQLSTIVPS